MLVLVLLMLFYITRKWNQGKAVNENLELTKLFYITRKWNQGKAAKKANRPTPNFTSLENGIKAKLIASFNAFSLILHHSKMESRQSP